MATSLLVHEQIKPKSTKTWQPPVAKSKARKPELVCEGMRFLSFFERLLLSIMCNHQWTWPHTLDEYNYPLKSFGTQDTPEVRYDAHQTCPHCTAHRLWHTKSWTPGPVFRRVLKQNPVANAA